MKINKLKKQINNYTSSSFDIPFEYEKIKDYAYNKEFDQIEVKEKKRINLKVLIPSLSLSFVSIIVLLIIMIPPMSKKNYETQAPSMAEAESFYSIKSVVQGKINRSNYDMALVEPANEASPKEDILTYELNYNNESFYYLIFTNINNINEVKIDNINLPNNINKDEIIKIDDYYFVYWYSDSLLNVLYSKTNNIDDFLNVYNEMK